MTGIGETVFLGIAKAVVAQAGPTLAAQAKKRVLGGPEVRALAGVVDRAYRHTLSELLARYDVTSVFLQREGAV